MSDQAGVQIPEVDGVRSTSALGRAIVGDALRAVDPVGSAAVARDTNWRRGYLTHFRRLVEAGVPDPAAATTIARDGLTSLHSRMHAAAGGEPVALARFLDAERPTGRLRSQTVSGSGEPETELSVPFDGRRLRGQELRDQLHAWDAAGVLEPGAVAAVEQVIDHPEWLSLPGQTVVALGAASEMGPVRSLLRWEPTSQPSTCRAPSCGATCSP